MARESSLPRLKHLQEALPAAEVVLRVVENAVTQAGTDNHTDQHGVEKRIEKFLVNSFPAIETADHVPSENEP